MPPLTAGDLATNAQLSGPLGTAVAPDGTLYIADYNNDRIRKVAPNGIITTIAGSVGGFAGDGGQATAARLNGPISLALDPAGNLFLTDVNNYRVRKIAPNGMVTTLKSPTVEVQEWTMVRSIPDRRASSADDSET